MKKGIVIDAADNVGITLEPLERGENIDLGGRSVEAREAIAPLHKLALRDIPRGGVVIKYGQTIGYATRDISAGQWVHVHNLDAEKLMR